MGPLSISVAWQDRRYEPYEELNASHDRTENVSKASVLLVYRVTVDPPDLRDLLWVPRFTCHALSVLLMQQDHDIESAR